MDRQLEARLFSLSTATKPVQVYEATPTQQELQQRLERLLSKSKIKDQGRDTATTTTTSSVTAGRMDGNEDDGADDHDTLMTRLHKLHGMDNNQPIASDDELTY